MAAPPESPFKTDEPVSTSRKWIIIAGIWLSLVLPVNAWFAWLQLDVSFESIPYSMLSLCRVVGVVAHAMLIVFAFRAARAVRRCREHRNFDVMAGAVRAQRPFWILLGSYATLAMLTMVLSTLMMRNQTIVIKNWIERAMREARSRPQPSP
jgi:hypothetical protein